MTYDELPVRSRRCFAQQWEPGHPERSGWPRVARGLVKDVGRRWPGFVERAAEQVDDSVGVGHLRISEARIGRIDHPSGRGAGDKRNLVVKTVRAREVPPGQIGQ